MPSNNAQEALKAFASLLDDFVREAVGEDLAGEGRDVDSRALALEDVTEGFEVGIAPAHEGMSQLECGDVGLQRGVRSQIRGGGLWRGWAKSV